MADHRTRTRDRRLRRVNQITAAGLIGGTALAGVWSVAAAHSYSGASDPSPEEPAAVVPDPTAATPAPTTTEAPTSTTRPVSATTAPRTSAGPRAATSPPVAPKATPTTQPTTTRPQVTAPTRRRKHGTVSGGS